MRLSDTKSGSSYLIDVSLIYYVKLFFKNLFHLITVWPRK